MSKPKFETLTGKDGKFYFRLLDGEGEIILNGRGFGTKYEVMHAMASTMRYAVMEKCYEKRENHLGQYFFQLKSPSQRLLAWSEMFPSAELRDEAIRKSINAVVSGYVTDLN